MPKWRKCFLSFYTISCFWRKVFSFFPLPIHLSITLFKPNELTPLMALFNNHFIAKKVVTPTAPLPCRCPHSLCMSFNNKIIKIGIEFRFSDWLRALLLIPPLPCCCSTVRWRTSLVILYLLFLFYYNKKSNRVFYPVDPSINSKLISSNIRLGLRTSRPNPRSIREIKSSWFPLTSCWGEGRVGRILDQSTRSNRVDFL